MAVMEYFQNMYDFRLKPRMLWSLIKEHLPDENHPFPSHSELSNVVSAIKTHGLLTESYGEPLDQKLLVKWHSAIDAWIERLLLLISSKMPDKCWAGICLLGVTCQECSIDRFSESYSSWFQNLLSQIQQPSDSHFVKVAACCSLSDMFTRLGGILNVKKDGISLAGKLIQPILKLLAEDGSEAVWEGAVDLLCTLVNSFPSAVYRHYEAAEAVIVSKIMSGKCSTNVLKIVTWLSYSVKKFAQCLAMLPKARGDDDSWSLTMQKILISINIHLNDAFQGLEEEIRSSEAMRLLVPPGKDPPSPLGGQVARETCDQTGQLLISRVSTLILSCSMMLANPYPVQVTVPVRSLLALIRRVLLVDGSLSQALMPFLTVLQQADMCSQLPILHLHALDLLIAVIKGTRSQLLPNAADIVRLLTEYFRRCVLAALRIKVYSIMKILLVSLGVGMTSYLAQEVIKNAFADLDPYCSQSGGASIDSTYAIPATYALKQPSNRKRKHATEDDQKGGGLEVEAPKIKPLTPVAVQIAALEALEALLTVGGALKSECRGSNVDCLLINIATNACDGGWSNDEKTTVVSGELTSTWADFQLTALHALFASLLSPARVRPPYLSQGLQLFHRGKQEAGTKLSEFCAHALLALEVLIHPRTLPLMDSSLRNSASFEEVFDLGFPGKVLSSGQKDSSPFARGAMGIGDPDLDDELYDSWVGNGEEVEAPVTSNTDRKIENPGEPSEGRDQQARENPSTVKRVGDVSVDTLAVVKNDMGQSTGSINVNTGRCTDEAMVDAETIKVSNEPIAVVDVDNLNEGAMVAGGMSNPDLGAMSGTGIGDQSGRDEGDLVTTKSASSKRIEHMFEELFGHGANNCAPHSDSDSDSIPDIICNPPDSDQEADL